MQDGCPGITKTKYGSTGKEISCQVTKANRIPRCTRMSDAVEYNIFLSFDIRTKIHKTTVKPILKYGAETSTARR